MLTITQEAEQAIRGILDASNAPDGSVLRISPQPAQQDDPAPGRDCRLRDRCTAAG